MWLIGREKTKSGPDKGKMVPSVNRKIDLEKIAKVRGANSKLWFPTRKTTLSHLGILTIQ